MGWWKRLRSNQIDEEQLREARRGNQLARRQNTLVLASLLVAVIGVVAAIAIGLASLRGDSDAVGSIDDDRPELPTASAALTVSEKPAACVSSTWFARYSEATPEALAEWLDDRSGRARATEWMTANGGMVQPSVVTLAVTNDLPRDVIVEGFSFRVVAERDESRTWSIWRDGGDCGGDEEVSTRRLLVEISRTGVSTTAGRLDCATHPCRSDPEGDFEPVRLQSGDTLLVFLNATAANGVYELLGEVSFVYDGEFARQPFDLNGEPLTVHSSNTTDPYHVACAGGTSGTERRLVEGHEPFNGTTCWGGLGGP